MPVMNVVINALSARTGGGLTYLRNLLAVDAPGGMRVHALVLPNAAVPRLGKGIEVVRLPGRLANPLVRAAWERRRLPGLLRELGAGVLFCPGGVIAPNVPPGCRTATMFRNMLPFDVVQRSRYPWGYIRARTTLLEPVLVRSMRRADLVVFVSQHGLDLLVPRLSSFPARRVVIPHGVSEEFRSAGPLKRPEWLPNGKYLLYVSNFEPYKRQLEVVQAFTRLRFRRPGEEKLVLVGLPSSRGYAASVLDEVARLGVQRDVLLAHNVTHDDLPAVYQHATVSIFASECENCPNILLEAMAAGRPLLVSKRPPMSEFAGPSALYFDPTDPAELAEQLSALLDDPVRQEKMGVAAEIQARAYDWQETGKRTWEALSDLFVGV